MTRRITGVAAGLLVALLTLTFAGRVSAYTPDYSYNFDNSLNPWTAGVDCSSAPFEHPCDTTKVMRLEASQKMGSYAALYNRGVNAVWMRSDYNSYSTGSCNPGPPPTPVPVAYTAAGALNVFNVKNSSKQPDLCPVNRHMAVEFDAFNANNGQRLEPIIYADRTEPGSLNQFQKIGLPLENGWQRITYKAVIPETTGWNTQLIIAVGFMNLDSAKTTQAGGIDNVQITFFP